MRRKATQIVITVKSLRTMSSGIIVESQKNLHFFHIPQASAEALQIYPQHPIRYVKIVCMSSRPNVGLPSCAFIQLSPNDYINDYFQSYPIDGHIVARTEEELMDKITTKYL